ncbi:MAG: hypothetical protein F4153_06870, partial [Acidimicrobiia bacterium]|nr:hypothetical protein [Acidimicrobiia bacterium]
MNPRRVSPRLVLTTLVVLAVIAASTTAGWIAAGDSQSQSTLDRDISSVGAALEVIRHAKSLAEAASVRTHAGMSPQTLADERASANAKVAALNRHLDILEENGHEQAAAQMRELAKELMHSTAQLENGRLEVAQVLRDSQSRREELIAATTWQLLPAAVASEDDVFYRLITDHRDGGSHERATADAVTPDELLWYARLALLHQQIDQGYIVLEAASRQTDSAFITTIEDNMNLVMYQLRDSLERFSENPHEDIDPSLVPLARDLVDAAFGEENLIDLMKARLRLVEQEAQFAAVVVQVSASLQSEAEALLDRVIHNLERTDGNSELAEILRAGFAVRRHSDAVINASAAKTSAAAPLAEIDEVGDTIAADISEIHSNLVTLDDAGYKETARRLRSEVDRLAANTKQINIGRPELRESLQVAARQRGQLRSFMDYQMEPAVVVSLDNQLYYMLTGRSEFRDGEAEDSNPLSRDELLRYRHLSLSFSSLFRTFSGLIVAIITTDPTLVSEGEERFATAAHRLERSISYLEEAGGAEVAPEVVPLARELIA